jgi:hypothetical protein
MKTTILIALLLVLFSQSVLAHRGSGRCEKSVKTCQTK